MERPVNLWHAAAAFLLLAACTLHFLAGDAGDKEWQLYAARQLLLGHRLYVDAFFDVNTPLLIWLYTLPSFVALHVPFLTDAQALVLLGLGLIAGIIALSLRLMKLHPAFAGSRERGQFALLLAFIFVFYTNPGYFLHREQLFLLLAFPYILRFMPTLARQKLPLPLSILIGVMAGIGFSLKPYCLVIFAGIQCITLLRERSASILISVENICIYALSLLYALAVWYFTPEYLSVVLPMAMATYGAANRIIKSLLYLATELFLFALPLADFRLRYTSPYRRDIFYCMALCGFFLIYALLNNGWGYTYNLVNLMVLLATGLLLFEYRFLKAERAALGENTRPFLFGERACWTSFAINAVFPIYIAASLFFLPCYSDENCQVQDALTQEVMHDGHVHSFSALSIEFIKWVRLARETGASWDSRFHHLWMLPKFFGSDAAFTKAHQGILDYVAGALADELNTQHPDIVFVDDTDSFFSVHKRVDLVAYLSRMPAFAHAFAAYRYAYSIDECNDPLKRACKYDVYRRR